MFVCILTPLCNGDVGPPLKSTRIFVGIYHFFGSRCRSQLVKGFDLRGSQCTVKMMIINLSVARLESPNSPSETTDVPVVTQAGQ